MRNAIFVLLFVSIFTSKALALSIGCHGVILPEEYYDSSEFIFIGKILESDYDQGYPRKNIIEISSVLKGDNTQLKKVANFKSTWELVIGKKYLLIANQVKSENSKNDIIINDCLSSELEHAKNSIEAINKYQQSGNWSYTPDNNIFYDHNGQNMTIIQTDETTGKKTYLQKQNYNFPQRIEGERLLKQLKDKETDDSHLLRGIKKS